MTKEKTKKMLETMEMPVYGNYDVIIVGGGTAGVVAALSAARNGASVLVIEKHTFLGGSLLAGAICFMGFFNVYKPYPNKEEVQLIRGIPDEIVQRLVKEGASIGFYEEFGAIDYDSKSVSWDREKLPLVLMKMLQEADVEVLVGTQFVNAIMEENTIRGVIFCDKNGRHAAYGKSIVDTSGIAEVAYQAGADCTVLKERQTGGMSLGMDNVDMDKLLAFAQEKEAIRLLSYKMKGKVKEHIARLTLDLRKLQEFQEVVAPMVLLEDGSDKDESVEYKSKIEQFHFMDSPCMIANKKNSFNMINAVTANFDTTDPEECQRMRIELTRSCFKLAQELRTHVPGFENAQLDWVSPDIGIRFGRLVGCEYDITVEDVNELVIPTDVVGVYGVQDAYLAAGKNYRIEGGWYGIPYRALVPRRVENLLVAGEMITSDWIVWMSIRLSGGCMLMGQAAGTAAALAARQGISPRELDYAQLREALLKDGAFLG